MSSAQGLDQPRATEGEQPWRVKGKKPLTEEQAGKQKLIFPKKNIGLLVQFDFPTTMTDQEQ